MRITFSSTSECSESSEEAAVLCLDGLPEPMASLAGLLGSPIQAHRVTSIEWACARAPRTTDKHFSPDLTCTDAQSASAQASG